MKKITLLGAMAAALLSGCTKVPADHGENGGRLPEDTRLYISAGIALPTASGTRSATDDYPDADTGDTNSDEEVDYEYGHDYESDVRSVLLVFADDANGYITHTYVSDVAEAPVSGQKFDFVVTGELSYKKLEEAYKSSAIWKNSNHKVNVWVYCNYTGRLVTLFEGEDGDTAITVGSTDWLNWEGSVTEQPSAAGKPADIPNTIWAKGAFLMTNAYNEDNEFEFPGTIEGWDEFTSKDKPYRLGPNAANQTPGEGELKPIRVERAAARIDFKDGSEKGNQIYPLMYTTQRATEAGPDGDPEAKEEKSYNLYSVKLTRMALVNMSKNFYYLRRVSDDGKATNAEVGGYEKSRNYVVDTDWSDKIKTEGNEVVGVGVDNTNFNFKLFSLDSSNKPYYDKDAWYVDNIVDVLARDKEEEKDLWKDNSYHIWRYVTENTIPAPIENQITVQSTGVVFKGQITAGTQLDNAVQDSVVNEKVRNALKAAADAGTNGERTEAMKDLYSFEGALYAGIDELVKASVIARGTTLYTALEKALKAWKLDATTSTYIYGGSGTEVLTPEMCYAIIFNITNTNDQYYEQSANGKKIDFYGEGATEAAVDNFNTAVAKVQPAPLGITVYRASNEGDSDGWGYYCYYFYWNRHNDNGKPGIMGPMEFATVRNNVYKLAVTKISEFGHPRNPDFDPDPVDPKDPDEEPKVYFQVQVEVLPWVVRVNDIEF